MRPTNKFERNEKKKKKRERLLVKEDRPSRVRRKVYREQIKDQETEDELRDFKEHYR